MLGHRAYSFDPRKFHADLAGRTIRDQEFRSDLLYALAVEVASHPSDVTREVLQRIRYDEEDWLETDNANLGRWYMIALAAVMFPTPYLSIPSYNMIKDVLPVAGLEFGRGKRTRLWKESGSVA